MWHPLDFVLLFVYQENGMAKKKSNKKQPLQNTFTAVGKALSNRTFHVVLGFFLIFSSVFLLLAFSSFFFNWKADQSAIDKSFFSLLFDTDYQVKNLLGKVGAAISHQFIYNWFGVASYLFVIGFAALGLKINFDLKTIKTGKLIRNLVFIIILASATFGYLFGTSYPIMGGNVGYQLNFWLQSLLGGIGTGLFLLFTIIAYVAIRIKLSPEKLAQMFAKKEKLEELSSDEETEDFDPETENFTPEVEASSELEMEPTIQDDYGKELEEEPEQEKVPESNIELETEIAEEEEVKTEESDVEISVEQTEEEDNLTAKELKSKLKEFGEYDPKLDLSRFKLPTLDLLNDYGKSDITVNQEELEANKNRIVETLGNYNIGIAKIKATIGPTVTLYEIVPDAGVRISKIKNLEDDIALSLSALGIRIIAPIPGRGTIGIEVPNKNPNTVAMKSAMSSEKFQNSDMELPIAFGKTISNETYIADLAKMPHLLMAGATGQGKSVGLNVILTSLLYKKHPSQVKFVLVDPKKVELTLFNKIERHYLAKLPDEEEAIITDTKKVINTLNSLCIEMDQRYDLLKNAMARNIKEYNAKFIKRKLNPEEGHKYLPYIVLVIDEFADLIMTAGKEVETPIARLAQLARAIGIHLIVATQRPSVNVITGIIKANFPARIAFRVTSKIDSRTILDAGGADQLIGKGDMLLSTGNDLIRIQCAFVDTPEVEKITDYIGSQQAYPEALLLPEYVGEESSGGTGGVDLDDRDVLFEEAARVVVATQQGSASLLQRKLKLGYNRAGRIVDQLEAAGIIGPFEGSKARQVLVPDEMALEQLLNNEKENN